MIDWYATEEQIAKCRHLTLTHFTIQLSGAALGRDPTLESQATGKVTIFVLGLAAFISGTVSAITLYRDSSNGGIYPSVYQCAAGFGRNARERRVPENKVFQSVRLYFGFVRTAQDSPMASLAGVEPATCRLGGGCSILLSYRDVKR